MIAVLLLAVLLVVVRVGLGLAKANEDIDWARHLVPPPARQDAADE